MKSHMLYQETLKLSQVALLKKSDGQIMWKDGFDNGIVTETTLGKVVYSVDLLVFWEDPSGCCWVSVSVLSLVQ